MTGRSRRARNLIWLTPESLQAAERLSGLTGMPVPDLIELVLLELMEHEVMDGPDPADAPPASAPLTGTRSRGPATVIPIKRGRAAAQRGTPAAAAASDLDEIRHRCSLLRIQAERARLASVRARERASAVLEERGSDE